MTTAARAVVVFDVGGVPELPAGTRFDARWERRLGLAPGGLFERLRRSGLGRAANLGQVSEAELADGLAELYGLDREATGELLADLWDWYAGEPNTGMIEYRRRPPCGAGALRLRRTGRRPRLLLRGGRGAKVGMRAVLFRTTAQAIADVQACLEEEVPR